MTGNAIVDLILIILLMIHKTFLSNMLTKTVRIMMTLTMKLFIFPVFHLQKPKIGLQVKIVPNLQI